MHVAVSVPAALPAGGGVHGLASIVGRSKKLPLAPVQNRSFWQADHQAFAVVDDSGMLDICQPFCPPLESRHECVL